MGLTYVNVVIASPTDLKRQRRRKLLPDGSTIRRDVGNAFIRINGRQAPTPIIFGEKGDGTLLGVIALESLGLTIDPRTGKLRPTPLFLM